VRDLFKKYLEIKSMNMTYWSNIKPFMDYCKLAGIEYGNITYENAQEFFLAVKKKGLTKRTFNAYIFSVRSFYKFLVESGRVTQDAANIIKTVKPVRPDQVIKDYITKEEVGEIIEMGETFCEFIDPVKLRALLYFLFYTGLRKNEVLNLKRIDVDLDKRTVIVRIPTKNRSERVVFLPKKIVSTKTHPAVDVVKLIKEYFMFEGEVDNAFNMTRNKINNLMKNLKDFSPKKNLTCHMFRHSFARMLARNGVDSRIAQKLLGHKDIMSTLIYYDPDVDIVQSVYNDKVK
jgi:integrase/recombinase XerC